VTCYQDRFDYTYDIDTIDGTGNPVYKGLRTERGVDEKRKRRIDERVVFEEA
jgi:hypothetical protein